MPHSEVITVSLGRELDERGSTEVVRNSLRAIRQLPFPLGASAIASYLVGNPSKTLQKHELHKLNGFASLRQYSEGTVKRLLRRYVAAGVLAIDTEHNTLRITRRAVEIIDGRRENCVRMPPARLRRGATGGIPSSDKVPAPEEAGALAERFVAACRAGDARAVEQVFTEDVEVHSDGGGKAAAAGVVVRGRDRAARFLAGVFSKKRADCEMHATAVNGEPGVVFTRGGAVVLVVALRIEGGVRAVYMTNNPDKLARWSVADVE